MAMDTKKHNGWANYMTWRVMLEYFNDYVPSEEELQMDDYQLSTYLKEELQNYISEISTGIALDYALLAIDDVDYREIATAVLRINND
jgi:hypothetical protein